MTSDSDTRVLVGAEQAVVAVEDGPLSNAICVPRKTPIPDQVISETLEESA